VTEQTDPPAAELDAIFGLLGEPDMWQRALQRAIQPEPPIEPYFKTDEERALDTETWAIYEQQNRRSQAELGARATAGKAALASLRRLNATHRKARERFRCFCPSAHKACPLVIAYAWTAPHTSPLRGQDTLLLVANRRTTQRATFPDWHVDTDRLDPDDWLPISCDHGDGRFPNGIPGQILNARYTPSSGRRRRCITDLLGVPNVEWTASTPMLRAR